MKASNLIIDGIDYIGTFYHEIKGDTNKEMYVQHDDDEWSEVEEFGYTKIAYKDIGYFTGWIGYDKVKAVKIRVYQLDTGDHQEYIYK